MKIVDIKFRDQTFSLSCSNEAQLLELKRNIEKMSKEILESIDHASVTSTKLLYMVALRLSYDNMELKKKRPNAGHSSDEQHRKEIAKMNNSFKKHIDEATNVIEEVALNLKK